MNNGRDGGLQHRRRRRRRRRRRKVPAYSHNIFIHAECPQQWSERLGSGGGYCSIVMEGWIYSLRGG